jgi:predicted ribosome quality control (RQC) complex YloA/Tae2 family protein
MAHRIIASLLLSAFWLVTARTAAPQFQPRDYLGEEEADKIRDADTPAARIKLYVAFAEDRLKKFDYELNRTTPERNRTELLNSLLNGYAGCVDDGADQIAMAREKQMDIHAALKLMRTKYNEFLAQLQKYDKDGKDLDSYRNTLEDAIQGTKDAISDVEEAEKEMLPAPVRRKPS